MVRKIIQWFVQLFCAHDWEEVFWDAEREFVIYFCTRCGKVK